MADSYLSLHGAEEIKLLQSFPHSEESGGGGFIVLEIVQEDGGIFQLSIHADREFWPGIVADLKRAGEEAGIRAAT